MGLHQYNKQIPFVAITCTGCNKTKTEEVKESPSQYDQGAALLNEAAKEGWIVNWGKQNMDICPKCVKSLQRCKYVCPACGRQVPD